MKQTGIAAWIWFWLLVSACHSSIPVAQTEAKNATVKRKSAAVDLPAVQQQFATDAAGTNDANPSGPTGEAVSHADDVKYHPYFIRVPQSAMMASLPEIKKSSDVTILIVIDALNANHLGMYGYERNTSPNLDAFAKEGVVFTQWISNSSWTRPSFTTMITGVPKAIHGMELTDHKLSASIETMAERFQKRGYRTAAFVGNPLIQKKWRYGQGFDQFEDSADLGDFPRSATLVNRAIDWVHAVPQEESFFLVLFLTDPHAPYDPLEDARVFSTSYAQLVTSPKREVKNPLDAKARAGMVAAYDDEIAFTDSQIGRFFSELKIMGIYDRATIVVTADHGEIFGEHNCYQHAYHMWEPVLRVPMIIRVPGMFAIPDGDLFQWRYEDRPFSHTDLMPTLLHASGGIDHTEWGNSVFIDLSLEQRPIVSAYNARGVIRRAARMDGLKLIRYEKVNQAQFEGVGAGHDALDENPSLMIPGPRYELYNLDEDVSEETNIYTSNENNEVVRQLRRAVRPKPSPNKKEPNKNKGVPALDEDTLNALKAAGYIQ